jgi:hypothetical protein
VIRGHEIAVTRTIGAEPKGVDIVMQSSEISLVSRRQPITKVGKKGLREGIRQSARTHSVIL